jgi:signal transduction histidine kinase
VIGLLREEGGVPLPAVRQPTLGDIDRLVEETRHAGARIDFQMQVRDPEAIPAALGRDAYRIVQEALTNVGKHASGAPVRVRVTGAPGHGLHVSVRNPDPVGAQRRSVLPGAGAGLLGLQERVQLSGGTLVHGPDGSGDFVVNADLRW